MTLLVDASREAARLVPTLHALLSVRAQGEPVMRWLGVATEV
jgi:hypothetical protein